MNIYSTYRYISLILNFVFLTYLYHCDVSLCYLLGSVSILLVLTKSKCYIGVYFGFNCLNLSVNLSGCWSHSLNFYKILFTHWRLHYLLCNYYLISSWKKHGVPEVLGILSGKVITLKNDPDPVDLVKK